MTIFEGSEGSVNGYYKKKKIISRPLGNGRTLEGYKNEAQMVLVQALRDGNNLPNIKKLAIMTLKNFRYQPLIKQPDTEDKDFILFALLILIKLGVVDEDGVTEGLLVMGRKKPRRDCETH